MVRRAFRSIVTIMLCVLVVAGVVWSTLALWFDGPQSRLLSMGIAGCVALVSLLSVARVRPLSRGLLVSLLPLVPVVLWWTSIAPSNSREWTPDVARPARASFNGSSVTI